MVRREGGHTQAASHGLGYTPNFTTAQPPGPHGNDTHASVFVTQRDLRAHSCPQRPPTASRALERASSYPSYGFSFAGLLVFQKLSLSLHMHI